MRSERIEMSVDEYEVLPWRWGWKYEYMDGHAHITPRDHYVILRADVAPREVTVPADDEIHLQILAAHTNKLDEQRLVSTFVDAFADSVEFCDAEYAHLEAAAWKNINGFFIGKRGKPHPASRIAIVQAEHSPVIGAALVVVNDNAPVLDLLMVRRGWQRCELATALVAAVMNDLHAAGERTLRSAYHIATAESAAWHRRFGFVEEPDLFLAKLRWRAAQHELRREQRLQRAQRIQGAQRLQDVQVTDWEKLGRLESECRETKAQVSALEQQAEREGYEAVMPLLRYA